MRLEGKAAIVTGAGRGIGKAIATRFLRDGARVCVCDVVESRIQDAAEELGRYGDVFPVAADVSDRAACREVVARARERLGGVDVVVNNAGIARWEPFLDHTDESWDRTVAVNLTAVFLLSQETARVMVEQGSGGVILSTASNNGHVPEKGVAAYNASKAGVIVLTKTMAIELAPYGIRANCVSPGHIGPTDLSKEGGAGADFFEDLTAGIPLGRYGRVEEVAQLFAFLASDEAQFINGESIVIDGGQLAGQ